MTAPSDRPPVFFNPGPAPLPAKAPVIGPQAPARTHSWQTSRPMSLEETGLLALEEKLAIIRRELSHAGLVRCELQEEVRALAALTAGLHHQVARRLAVMVVGR